MKKATTIIELLWILEKALKEYPGPGPGLKKFRCNDPMSPDNGYSTRGYIWIDLPVSYAMILSGLNRRELKEIERMDRTGHLYLGHKNGKLIISIVLYGGGITE